jgi:hypothetical protein
MELLEFYEKVESHAELKGIGIDRAEADKPCVIVAHGKSGLTTKLPIAAIEKADWEIILDVLTGKREPLALQHMTRVVGYFSRVENWNQSKIGELKDRHKGNYAVTATV